MVCPSLGFAATAHSFRKLAVINFLCTILFFSESDKLQPRHSRQALSRGQPVCKSMLTFELRREYGKGVAVIRKVKARSSPWRVGAKGGTRTPMGFPARSSVTAHARRLRILACPRLVTKMLAG